MDLKKVASAVLSAGLLASVSWAGDQVVLRDQKAKDSYSLGYQFGRNVVAQDVEIDEEVLIAALRDALKGRQAVLDQAEIADTIKGLRRKALAQQEQRSRERSAANLGQATAFLEKNKKNEGVTTLPSGLQYKIVRAGKGMSPKATDGVRVRYRGTLTDGTEFDNTFDMSDNEVPVIPVSGANKGWAEALQLMNPGSKWQLFVPPDLGFGDRQFGRIPANSVLIYELELLSVVDRTAANADAPAPRGQASVAGSGQKNE